METETVIKPEFFRMVQDKYRLYKNHKIRYDERIIENNRWYKSQYIRQKKDAGMVSPVTPFLFNTLASKHADAMDNYPEPNILEREEADKETALTLTKILPLQLDMNDFKKTYSQCWWYKLKNGAACYGIFFNPRLNHGIGDIDIKKIDLLNLFWEPGITDIQESRFLFHTALIDNDLLKEQFPEKRDIFVSTEQIDIRTYDDGQNVNQSDIYKDKSLVIDCYYKKDGTVHLLKYSGDTILAATEDEGRGLYEHGMYPFVFDVMYPDEDSPVGFGLVDIIKNPQLYIDKLDSIIVKNALVSGKQRFMIKDNGGVNEEELADVSRDIIHVAGNVSEDNVREFQPKTIHPFIAQHRDKKIEELKEIAGNRDFQQGGTTSGVTAYSAIVALQQAGEKLSRDMIAESYEAYKDIIYMCVELIRQFYDLPRKYRTEGDQNEVDYLTFDNSGMTQEIPGDGLTPPVYRRAEFDVKIVPQKYNPYNKVAENQTLMELWNMGIFNPQNIEQSLLMLDCMQFDSKAKVVQGLQRMLQEQRAQQMAQMQMQQAMAAQQQAGQETIDTPQGRLVSVPIG